MELSRNEVVALYNAFSNESFKEMSVNLKKAFLINAIKLKSFAEKVSEENTSVAEGLKTKEYTTALNKYLEAKGKNEHEKTKESKEEFIKASEEFEPIFKDMEEKFNDAVSELDQTFNVELVNIPVEDFFRFCETKYPNGYTFNDIMLFEKLLN